jgi:hypothetical protein
MIGTSKTIRQNDLTVMSVNYFNKEYLDIQIELVHRRNGYFPRWMVVDNSFGCEHISCLFNTIEGIPWVDHGSASGSYHDASALNKGMREINTRYVLIMHPDCFVVYPNYIQESLDHMQKNNLVFFGVPCHPRKASSYRYFPYTACMFIDLSKIDKDKLDFTPLIGEKDSVFRLHIIEILKIWLLSSDKGYVFDILKSYCLGSFLRKIFPVYSGIGLSGDT